MKILKQTGQGILRNSRCESSRPMDGHQSHIGLARAIKQAADGQEARRDLQAQKNQ